MASQLMQTSTSQWSRREEMETRDGQTSYRTEEETRSEETRGDARHTETQRSTETGSRPLRPSDYQPPGAPALQRPGAPPDDQEKRREELGSDMYALSEIYPDEMFVCCLRSKCKLGDPRLKGNGLRKMEYKNRQWHEDCFVCSICQTPIGTKSFIPKDPEMYCKDCYEEHVAARCTKCGGVITSDGVTYKTQPWHRDCFTCAGCNCSLAGQKFALREERPYCAQCFGELFAKRCTACSRPIVGMGGTRYISFEDCQWHNECFVCGGCGCSLIGEGFVTEGPEIICLDCAKKRLMRGGK